MFESAACVRTSVRYPTTMPRTRVRPARPAAARRRRLAIGLTLTVTCAAWAGPVARAVDGAETTGEQLVARSTYVVEPGDSLWSIAEDLAPGSDPRPLVDAIAEANDVFAGELAPGEILVIPP